ncbi:hypothetical protein [Streptomyces parvus]|uniref:hypothetical protein n=1 Tax=Streptomyces parvus TaxID=66428 RepID=UPI00363FB0D5
MSALTVDPAPGPGQDWDDLVRIWEETDAPEGCRVEIIDEIVTVSPPPSTDPWHSGRPTATLYGEPEGGTYRVLETVEYGRELTLPEPFGLVLDTGVFPIS